MRVILSLHKREAASEQQQPSQYSLEDDEDDDYSENDHSNHQQISFKQEYQKNLYRIGSSKNTNKETDKEKDGEGFPAGQQQQQQQQEEEEEEEEVAANTKGENVISTPQPVANIQEKQEEQNLSLDDKPKSKVPSQTTEETKKPAPAQESEKKHATACRASQAASAETLKSSEQKNRKRKLIQKATGVAALPKASTLTLPSLRSPAQQPCAKRIKTGQKADESNQTQSDQKLPATSRGPKPRRSNAKSTIMTAGRYPDEELRDQPEQGAFMEGELAENLPPNQSLCLVSSSSSNMDDDDDDDMMNPHNNDNSAVVDTQDGEASHDNFARSLKQRGLEIREQEGDGNCLFRAVSLQVYGDPNMHGEVRKRCLDFMAKEEEHFSHFVENEPFKAYIQRKQQDGVHGNNPEIQAISELFNRPVEVFVPENGAKPLNIFQSEYKTSDVPIRLSYHDGNHYNAVVDPLLPTAGLGLGLPGLKPGLADKMQLEKAKVESDQLADEMDLEKVLKESHNDHLQRALKESSMMVDRIRNDKAIALSDVEATNFELEQAVLESSLDAYRGAESGRKLRATDDRRRRQLRDRNQDASTGNLPARSSVARHPATAAALPVASVPAAASVPSAASIAEDSSHQHSLPNSSCANTTSVSASLSASAIDEYPQTIQELVMNGFELSKVVHAYELVGDNFDDLLAFLVSTGSGH